MILAAHKLNKYLLFFFFVVCVCTGCDDGASITDICAFA